LSPHTIDAGTRRAVGRQIAALARWYRPGAICRAALDLGVSRRSVRRWAQHEAPPPPIQLVLPFPVANRPRPFEVSTLRIAARNAQLARARDGDSAAERKVVESFEPLIAGICSRSAHTDEAREDLAQELRLACVMSVRMFDPSRSNNLHAFVSLRLQQTAMMHARKRRTKRGVVEGQLAVFTSEMEDRIGDGLDHESEHVSGSVVASVLKELAREGDLETHAVVEAIASGKDVRDLSKETGKPPAYFHALLARKREFLRRKLGIELDEEE
jgi:RNA polymerase sigma factor (sigma-70 family)